MWASYAHRKVSKYYIVSLIHRIYKKNILKYQGKKIVFTIAALISHFSLASTNYILRNCSAQVDIYLLTPSG